MNENNLNAYGIISAVKNEGKYIEQTIESVINQKVKPAIWIIVNDGSSDNTQSVLNKYTKNNSFIKTINSISSNKRTVSSKVRAIHKGYNLIKDSRLSYIGILDGDVKLPIDYYQKMIFEFENNPKLGVVGGTLTEIRNGSLYKSKSGVHHVIGAVQLYRKSCFDSIGGIPEINTVGEDSAALIMARSSGWITKTVRCVEFLHLKPSGVTIKGAARKAFNMGVGDYSLGVIWPFLIAKVIRRIFWKPYGIIGLMHLLGFVYAFLLLKKKQMPEKILLEYRYDQMKRLKSLLKRNKILYNEKTQQGE